MKKSLFAAIGATGAAAMLILSLTFTAGESNASQQSKNNIAAFEKNGVAFGNCTGPRPQDGNCESRNEFACSDEKNCNSTSTIE